MHACIPTFGTKLTPKKFFFDKDQMCLNYVCITPVKKLKKKYLEEIDPTSIEYDFSFQRPKVLSQNEVKLNRKR